MLQRQSRYSFNKEVVDKQRKQPIPPIPFDKLWDEDIAVIEDQLYTDKALTDPMYRQALEYVIEEKKNEMSAQLLCSMQSNNSINSDSAVRKVRVNRSRFVGKIPKAKSPPGRKKRG